MTLTRRPPLTPQSRQAAIERLRRETLDVLIIGGGINGAGVARDLALRAAQTGRPLKIALVEQHHFASGASGRNSQLIHGGLRYLKRLEFGLVKEALRERAILLRIAPHLVEPLPFVIPFYGSVARIYYGAGLTLYDFLAGYRNVARRRRLSRDELIALEPGLERNDLTSAAIFYDCRVHSARLVLENLFDAARDGVVIANYLQAEEPTKTDTGFRVRLTDRLWGHSFETHTCELVDATGAWQRTAKLRLVRGSHIVLPRLASSDNAIAYFGEDGRIIFVIPWGPGHGLSLVGTTDCDHSDGPDQVRVTAEEVGYLMNVVRRLFPGCRDVQPVAAYSSLRPLVASGAASATKTSREHRIGYTSSGTLSISGGKYTTYRAMSEEAVTLLAERLRPELAKECLTAEIPVGGNSRYTISQLFDSVPELASVHNLEEHEARQIVGHYGLLAQCLLEYLPSAPPEGLSRLEAAVIAFTISHEMSLHLSDLLLVSTYWGYERAWTAETLQPYAGEMARHLGWSKDRTESEIELALETLAMPPDA